MNNNFYTVIAYKPNSSQYSMGCHMESFSSDMCYISSSDKKEVVKFLADKTSSNDFLQHQEDGYDFYFLCNGKEVVYNEDDENELDIFDEMQEIKKSAYELAADLTTMKKERQRVYEQEQHVRRQKEKEESQRRIYQDLKEKFGSE